MVQKNKKPGRIIAGPCAIESKKQLYETIKKIHAHIDVIRAGLWKGRTSPASYSGIGKKGLPWLKDIQKKYSLPIAIEVGTTEHIDLALKYDIRVFWIGARTTVNPFSVQEIATSLKGVDAEIWIKNPIIPDLKLWVGAIERFKKTGIENIQTIHRGFYCDRKIIYRNNPKWSLLEKFRKMYPNMPIICDPSHIAGNQKYIYQIAKKACNKGIDGLMVEVHNNPNAAKSDHAQQLNPVRFKRLLSSLNYTA
tara:strand:- start:137 stop:889 length:753 start_codon:yes stop_codon:yes gene_type:complete